MNITEIENLSFTELKSRRDEILQSILDEDVSIHVTKQFLATKYLQARTDAKQRDEKLSEQGTKISQLESELESEKDHLARARNFIGQLRKEASDKENEHVKSYEEIKELQSIISILRKENSDVETKLRSEIALSGKLDEINGKIDRLFGLLPSNSADTSAQ